MSRPTKFELMRQNRWRNRDGTPFRDAVKAGVTADRLAAAPFMLIDGVKHVEAPEEDEDETCNGCAFRGRPSVECFAERHASIARSAKAAFGGSCIERGVIYIRAGA